MALSPLISRNELGDPIGQDDDAPPSLTALPMVAPASMPDVQMPTLRPLITTPRMQRENYLQNAISSTPLGLTHGPAHGFWGNVRRIAEGIGNVAGDVLDPGAAERIPGSQLNREARVASGQRELAGLQSEDRADATAASENSLRGAQTAASEEATREAPGKAASEQGLQGAEKSHLNAETDALSQPQYEVHDTAAGPLFVNKKTGAAQHLSLDGLPVGPKIQTETVQLQIGGNPHAVLTNKDTGEVIKDLGPSGIKPPTVSVNEGREERNDVLKAYQPTLDSAERMNVMTESYEKAIKNHDQQAMLNLLANHLGMTMGLQKGSRITRDLYNEAAQSTPWLAKVGAKFDKDGYLSGVTLNPTQMRQMVDLAQSRYQEDAKRSRSTASYLGAKDDGPARIPGEATIRFYVAKANGDPQKAKQLAAQDGWSVQ